MQIFSVKNQKIIPPGKKMANIAMIANCLTDGNGRSRNLWLQKLQKRAEIAIFAMGTRIAPHCLNLLIL